MRAKIILGVTFFVIGGVFSLMLYDVSKMNTETIVLCASNEGGILIPSKACEYYLYNHRNIKTDVKEIFNGAGLSFILGSENTETKYKIAQFFITNGLDVNGINHYGEYNLTPIHAAVLFNDVRMVNFLLKNGASLNIKPHSLNMTPLEFGLTLQKKEPSIDRRKIIKILTNRVKNT